jgi:hypothetical protein
MDRMSIDPVAGDQAFEVRPGLDLVLFVTQRLSQCTIAPRLAIGEAPIRQL